MREFSIPTGVHKWDDGEIGLTAFPAEMLQMTNLTVLVMYNDESSSLAHAAFDGSGVTVGECERDGYGSVDELYGYFDEEDEENSSDDE